MREGYNLKYLSKKIQEYEQLIEKNTDPSKEEFYEETLFNYQMLYFDVLSQSGEVTYEKMGTKEFLGVVNEMINSYTFDARLTSIITKHKMAYETLDKIPSLEYSSKIKKQESFDLVSSFIQETFGFNDFLIFKRYFLEGKDFILFDKINSSSGVTVVNKEKYIILPNKKNIELASSLAHEAGHIRRIATNKSANNEELLAEFESFTYEVRFLKWLIENGVYEKDAAIRLLFIMKYIETHIILRYYNNVYKLFKIKDNNYFKKKVSELDLYNLANINSKRELFDGIFSSLQINFPRYDLNFIGVINEIDNKEFLEHFNNIITNLGVVSNTKLLKRNDIDINSLDNYKNIRKKLLERIR